MVERRGRRSLLEMTDWVVYFCMSALKLYFPFCVLERLNYKMFPGYV